MTNSNPTSTLHDLPKYAYATLLTRASYLPGVLLLAHTLRTIGHSRYPLLVLITPSTFPQHYISLLEREDRLSSQPGLLQILPIEPLHPNRPVNIIAERFADTWTKLRVFELHNRHLSKICFLDADTMITHDAVDTIFDIPLPSDDGLLANHACTCNHDNDPFALPDWFPANCPYTGQRHPTALAHGAPTGPQQRPTYQLMNSGVFVFRPTRVTWDAILRMLRESERVAEWRFPDQNFLDEFYRGRWASFGWQWNAVKTHRYWHGVEDGPWRDDEVVVCHYIVDKPWSARVRVIKDENGGEELIAGYQGKDGVTHSWWWREWESWVGERMKQGEDGLRGVEEMRELVAPPLKGGWEAATMVKRDD